MGKKEVVNAETLTPGQKKRLDRKKEIAAAKKKKKANKIIAIVVCAALVIGAGYGIGYQIYKNVSITNPISDFSKGLTADGKIDGVTVKDIVTTLDYNNISVQYADIELTDDELQEKIDDVLSDNKYYSDDATLTCEAGNTVNINYYATLNGETVEDVGNASTEAGLNFTISSTAGATATPTPTATPTATPTPTSTPSTYQALFQEDMLGMHPGETKEITVTIPDDFTVSSAASPIAGQTVVFSVTLNSIQVTPELTDEFVAETLKEDTGCSTADEYKTYVRETSERESLEDKITELVEDEDTTKLSSYPSKYLKIKKGQVMYSYQSYLAQINYYYSSYGISYDSIYDLYGKTWKEMEETITTSAKQIVTLDCAYQYLYEELGLSITDEEYSAYVLENSSYESVEEYEAENSKAYALKNLMEQKVIEKLADMATIVKTAE